MTDFMKRTWDGYTEKECIEKAAKSKAPWSTGLEAIAKPTVEAFLGDVVQPPMEETNGGRHSRLGMDFFRIPPEALKSLAKILHDGAIAHQDESGENWRQIPSRVHLNHASYHLNEHYAGKVDDDHMGHALTRLAMAVATR